MKAGSADAGFLKGKKSQGNRSKAVKPFNAQRPTPNAQGKQRFAFRFCPANGWQKSSSRFVISRSALAQHEDSGKSARLITIIHQRGLHLPEHDLWLDPHRAQPLAFVSHAHSDHIARHREVLMTAATARFMRARLSGKRTEHVAAFGEAREFAGGRATLLPAGHILGSAQLFFETDAGSLLYTGDFKLVPGLLLTS